MSGIVRPPLKPHMAILKPCPFCGSKWTQVRWIGFEDSLNSGYASGYRGECTDCGAMTLAAFTVETAAETWNRRADGDTADVRPVKEGHWISAYDGSVASLNSNGCPEVSCHCSECGDWLTASDEYYAKGRFCPNCGAKMGGDT